MVSLPPEKLGSFYLGAEYDIDKKETSDIAINYDARDLVTHAVCVGMTGSGKTGLCIGLLEEAALDKVPAIIIDPKGDMTNLLLQFEDLAPSDFKKWLNEDDARRKGKTLDEFASDMSQKWTEGLKDWGQDKSRIKALKNAVDYTIFTPGSDAGIPINILGSFAAPGINFDDDAEMLYEKIQGIVAALLGMIDSKEDPSKSREGILLSKIFEHYWRKNEDLDLTKIIMAVQNPPIQKLGVFDIETFYPSKDRFNLAMDFNTLVASPQFSYWLQGEPLDIQKIYFTKDGKPRHSIFYIAHLSESERMFFVTLLLNAVVTWMRAQSGTTSLRSLLYFDEIFGYFPPTAQPPSKKPLLTILKQARAYGVGAVLVTQNPVDIDYKGLSNAGTWFIGKLQTERDKMRVLDGLNGAIAEAGSEASVDFSKIISSLSSRVFLLHNVHADDPVVYHTRWAMSYLRGPLTRPQLKTLMEEKKKRIEEVQNISFEIVNNQGKVETTSSASANVPPSLEPGVDQRFFKPDTIESGTLVYQPQLLSLARVRFYDDKRGIDEIKSYSHLCGPPDDFGRVDWERAIGISNWESKLETNPVDSISSIEYEEVPPSMNSTKELGSVEKEYANWLYQTKREVVYEHAKLKITQESGESEESFRMKVQHAAREIRDQEIDKLKEKYEVKFDRIEEKIRREERDLDEAQAEISDRRNSEIMNGVETIFKVFTGRSKSLSTAATKRRMTRKAHEKKSEILEDLEVLNDNMEDLQKELENKLTEITDNWDNLAEQITEKEIKPRKTDVKVEKVILAWYPKWK